MFRRTSRLMQLFGVLGYYLNDVSRLRIKRIQDVPDALTDEHCRPRLIVPHSLIDSPSVRHSPVFHQRVARWPCSLSRWSTPAVPPRNIMKPSVLVFV